MNKLDNSDYIRKIDRSNMLGSIDFLPEMFEEAKNIASSKPIKPFNLSPENIIICGMGGSAIAGNIVKTCLDVFFQKNKFSKPISVFVNRDYFLPSSASKNSLIFLISYSGNTEETIFCYKQAKLLKARIIIITSGGRLEQAAKKNDDVIYLIPSGFQPRAALGYLLTPIIIALTQLRIYPFFTKDLEETIILLKKLILKYCLAIKTGQNIAKQKALSIYRKIPLFLATRGNESAALRLKTQLNESGKVCSFYNIFPELNHNEIVSLSHLRKSNIFSLFILRDQNELSRIKKRIEITKALLKPIFGEIDEFWAKGKSALAKIMSIIIFGDYLSVYCAVLKGIDPTPVEIISKLKEKLLH